MAGNKSTSSSTMARIAGLVFLLGSFWLVSAVLPFSIRGTAVQARVAGMHESYSRGRYYYYPEYELSASLKSSSCKSFSSSWFWSRPKVGDTVSVIYYLDAGRLICAPESLFDRWLSPLLLVFIGIKLLIGGKPVNL
jgi:hypothetical protein